MTDAPAAVAGMPGAEAGGARMTAGAVRAAASVQEERRGVTQDVGTIVDGEMRPGGESRTAKAPTGLTAQGDGQMIAKADPASSGAMTNREDRSSGSITDRRRNQPT